MDSTVDFEAFFSKCVGKSLRRDVYLKDYSSFKIGGPADFFYEATTSAELLAAVESARLEAVPFYVIGGGFNILFPDAGYRGLIIRNRSQGIASGPEPEMLEILSGTPLSRILQEAMDKGLEGLEFLAGIPGTVGGALYSNAGAFGRSMGDVFQEAFFLDGTGHERSVKEEEMEFRYRHSILQTKHEVVLSTILKAAPGNPEAIKAKIADILDQRSKKQPAWGTPCAGSYFKNPILPDGAKVAAAGLLEQIGAKDLRVGDAAVFSGHSNFIINLGQARACDVRALAADLKDKVRVKFGVELEEEVVILSETHSIT